MGDILPFEVLESVSKVKNAEIWNSHANEEQFCTPKVEVE